MLPGVRYSYSDEALFLDGMFRVVARQRQCIAEQDCGFVK